MKIVSLSRHALLPILVLAPLLQARAAAPGPAAEHLDKRLMPIAAAAAQHIDTGLRDAALKRQDDHQNSPFEARWNAAGQVQVYIHYDPSLAGPDHEQLAALGASDLVDSLRLGVIQAWIPASQLDAVSGLPGVLRVGLPRYAAHKRVPALGPVSSTGSVDTQGDSILQAASFRKSTGDTGQGVTVGVISDGDDHVGTAVKSGDLPGDIWNDPKNAGGSGGFSPASSGDEGTAMMEIVYDIAPGLDRLGFCGPQTSVDFVTCLDDFKGNISPGVIVDDLGFPGGAMFSDDSFTSAIRDFAKSNPSIHLVSAAGNDGTGFWTGTWNPMAVSATVNGVAYSQALDFGSGSPDLRISVNPGDVVTYIVEWDDPWSDTATANDPNDFDVVVFTGPDHSGIAVACNQGINIGPDGSSTRCNEAKSRSLKTPGPQPVQGSQWKAQQGSYYLEVFGVHGSLANRRIKILVYDQNGFQLVVTPRTAGSVYGHAAVAAPDVISVGAINADDLSLESFSSTGPVDTGTGGTRTSVAKPDFVAPDCVNVTGSGGFDSPFCGTSAAAPHIAGLMALLISGYPDTSPYELLQESATPRGKPVPNGEFGYGLPNMKTLLNKGVRPSPKQSGGGGGGDAGLPSLLALGFSLLRRRYTAK